MNGYMADFVAKNAKTGAFNHIHATGGGEEGYNKLMDADAQIKKAVASIAATCEHAKVNDITLFKNGRTFHSGEGFGGGSKSDWL